jgi:hypothetical protein
MSTHQCFVCDQIFGFGNRPGVYLGKPVQGWDRVMVCNRCRDSNWDGIVPTPALLSKFEAKGFKVEYNADGLIVFPP